MEEIKRKEIKTISINCESKDFLEIAEMTEFQGCLKSREDSDFDKIKQSFIKFGFSFPFFVWNDNGIKKILDGHGRFETLCKMQKDGFIIPPLPVVYVNCKSDKDARDLLLRLNSHYGKMTKESVLEFVGEYEFNYNDYELPEFNIDFGAVTKDEESKTEGDDVAPEVDEENEPDSKPGEMYELGNSILLCGDSTNAEDIARLMSGKKADLVFTDPPYGMKKEKDGVENDNLNFDDLLEFNKKWIPLSFENLKDVGSWYCWGIDEPLMDMYSNILRPMQKNSEITFRNLITWDKGSGQGQNSEMYRMYAIADEKCLFVMKGVQGFNTNQDNYFEAWEPLRQYFESEIKKLNESDTKIANGIGFKDGRTVNHWYSKSQWAFIAEENYTKVREYAKSKNCEIFKKEYEELKKEYYSTRAYFNNIHDNMNNVWHFGKTSGAERESAGGHATPKPLELCSRAIKSSSREGEIVLDLFGGSGSTLIACEKLNRSARLIELEPKWCDVIRRRYTQWARENNKPITSGCLD